MANKIALVTGASKGIGFEVARQLGQMGIAVVVAARTQAAANEAVEALLKEGIQAIALELEVTNSEHIARVVQFLEHKYGYLDILVNNAGISVENGDYEGNAFRDTFEVNTFALIILPKRCFLSCSKVKRGVS